MQKARYIILLLPLLIFFNSIPGSRADFHIPLVQLPYPDLDLYYLIEGESFLRELNPYYVLDPILPFDFIKVSFGDWEDNSTDKIWYQVDCFQYNLLREFWSFLPRRNSNTSLDVISRRTNRGFFCPYYLQYSGLPNILGIEFDWVFEYGGIQYIEWHGNLIKTVLYYCTFQDGIKSYSIRAYYDYTSLVLVQFEQEATVNLVQTIYQKGTLIVGNVLLTPANSYIAEFSQFSTLLFSIIISLIVATGYGIILLNKKKRVEAYS